MTAAIDSELDPRVERSRARIMDATLAELAGVGYGAMTIESIAKRAGVGKATVYRHWSGKLDLLASALDKLHQEVVVPDEGSVRERIIHLVTWLSAYITDSQLAACMPALVSAAQYDPAVRDFHHRFTDERRQVLIDLLDEGVAARELSADVDTRLLAETLVGPIFYRKLMTGEPFPPERAPELVALVLG